MFTKEYMEQIEERFEKKLGFWRNREDQIRETLKNCDKEKGEALKCLYAAMPISDGADYPVSLFEKFAEHGAYLWKEGVFQGQIPQEIFAGYVLFHRVNNEELTDHRRFFYEKVKALAVGKTMEEAVREINYWCASQVTYRSTDERTAGPVSVYQAGYGRCGEESAFVVSVLRSVGIPARQVYVPLWSHCDDNHAWVEVWCEGEWKFLGACEPEEILNKGWFVNAASRAMLVHSNWMLPGKPQKELAGKNGTAWMANQLSGYAKTTRLKIRVVSEAGQAVSGADVWLQVLNAGGFGTVARLRTDTRGCVQMETGLGSVLAAAAVGETYGEALLDTRIQTDCILTLKEEAETASEWEAFTVYAPKDTVIHRCEETGEQAERGRKRREEAVRIREGKERKENPEIQRFLQGIGEEGYPQKWKKLLVEDLREKDRREITAELLEEICRETAAAQEGRMQGCLCPEALFPAYVLNPRVKNEVLRPYRSFLRQRLSAEEKEEFCRNPEQVITYVEANIKEAPEWEYADLVTSAEGAFESGYGSSETKKILAVQILRTLGIPSRLNPMDGRVEFWKDGVFRSGGQQNFGKLVIVNSKTDGWKYGQNWTISRKETEGYRTLNPEGEEGTEEILLLQGRYRILTANRLPNGNSLCKKLDIRLREGEERRICLERTEACGEELLTDYQLEDFPLTSLEGRQLWASQLFEEAEEPCLFLWLDVGKEPTEHILNEIYQQREAFSETYLRLCFLVKRPEEMRDAALQRALEGVKKGEVFLEAFGDTMERLARRIYQEPGQLPLVLLADGKLRCRYGVAGYNVGTADMILNLLVTEKKIGYNKSIMVQNPNN